VADVREEQRITVGLSLRDLGGADSASRARGILDDDALPKRFRHRLAEDSSKVVARPAGGEGHHHRHDFVRIILRERARCGK